METFSIHVTFEDGSTMIERHTDDTVVSALKRLGFGPASHTGIIREVKCLDLYGEGFSLIEEGELVKPLPSFLRG